MPLPPLVSGSLPAATPGPYKYIGYSFIRAAPLVPWTLQSPKLSDGQPAISVQEVAYSVFYPCQKPASSWLGSWSAGQISWVPEPHGEVARGYERFLSGKGSSRWGWLLQASRAIIGRLAFPAYLNAVPATPTSGQLPLVIFSHGLAGTRHTYTQYCTALASRGYVVLAVEHKDGSGPMAFRPSSEEKGKDTTLLYTQYDELDWAGAPRKESLTAFRTMQSDMRVRELYETFFSFKSLVHTGKVEGVVSKLSEKEAENWKAGFRDKVDVDDLYLTAHSFGGCTVIQLLSQGPPDPAYSTLPTRRAVVLDPWLEPLPTPVKNADKAAPMPPLLVINSPGFSQWRGHFDRLLDMCKKANAGLMSIIGVHHQSFSDFPLLIPPSPTSALELLEVIHNLSLAHLEDRLDHVENLKTREPDQGKLVLDDKGKMVGKPGDVVVHLLPPPGKGK